MPPVVLLLPLVAVNEVFFRANKLVFLPEVREFIRDTKPRTNTP